MLSHKKSSLESYLEPLARMFAKVNPNFLTLLGSIPPLLFFVFVIAHWYLAALLIYLGNVVDLLDGMIARKHNKVTAFGGFLDSFMDRVSDFLIITSFAFGAIVRWKIAAPLLLFAYLTSYARSRGELASDSKVSFALGLIERSERLILIFFALLFYFLFPYVSVFSLNCAELIFLLIAGLSLYTVIQRVVFAYKKL